MHVSMASKAIHLSQVMPGAGCSQLIVDATSLWIAWVHYLPCHDLGGHHGRQCRGRVLSSEPNQQHISWRMAQKSSFNDDTQSVNCKVAWQLATVIISAKSCIYLQWFEGTKKEVPDSLSCDHHLPSLTSSLLAAFPHQLPNGLFIKLTLKEIASWLFSLLQRQTGKPMQALKQPQRSSLGHDAATQSTVSLLASVTSSLVPYLVKTDTNSRDVLHKQCEKQGWAKTNMSNWQNPLSTLPWTMWLRPLG